MRRYPLLAILAALALAAAACRPSAPPATQAIPPDSTAVAQIDLVKLRAAPVYRRLPEVFRGLVEPLGDAHELLLAWNGTELLLVAAGAAQPPAGYTPIGSGLAAAGPADRIQAARQALTSGIPASLTPHPANAEIRAVIRGDGKLPLAGNLDNFTRLLRMTEFTTVTAHVEEAVEVEIAAQCGSIDRSGNLEQSLRAIVTLATAGARDPGLAELLRSIRIARESQLVRINAMVKPEVFAKLF